MPRSPVGHRARARARRLLLAASIALLAAACGQPGDEEEAPAPGPEEEAPEAPVEPWTLDELPEAFQGIWDPWTGDLTGMVERRAIRVFAPYGGYQYYFVRGRPRGATVELVQRFEQYLNEQLGRGHVRVKVFITPVSRDRLLPSLTEGVADLVAADLTVTDARDARYAFTRPLLRDIDEVIVTGPSSPPLESMDDLAGREVYVRASSSYFEHLSRVSSDFVSRGLEPIDVVAADELLEAEDLLEMLNTGSIPLTVMDDYKARFWADAFTDVRVRDDLVINEGGEIAWAHRNDSPELAAMLEGFLRRYGRGTLVGNDTYNRYLEDAGRLRCQSSLSATGRYADLIDVFQRYGEQYDFDWLMLVAQGYQESRLRQHKKSNAGAVGIMQIKPSTAADPNVGIPDISTVENNVHAGAKYMRFIADRYFGDEFDPLQQWLFALAAYNAGPARVAALRREAAEKGYDRDLWFDNVEIIAARRIGAETVGYVSNVYKYYVGYKLAEARVLAHAERHGVALTDCAEVVD